MSRKNKISESVKAGLLKTGVFALCVGALPFTGMRSALASAKGLGEQEASEQGTFLKASETIPVPVAQGLSGAERAALPDKYDPRDKGWLTSVKNQGKWGTCWAHACTAAAEYSLIKKGEADVNEIDLSERHLAYFMYNTPEDPLGNAVGDENSLKDSNYLDAGADSRQAVLTLANWIGLADEGIAPYADTKPYDWSEKTLPESLADNLAYQDAAHLANSYWISPDNRDSIKQELMNTGAAFISLMFLSDEEGLKTMYNKDTYAFYNGKRLGGGHAGLVVGWDDNFPKGSFVEGNQPEKDGAWLVRNSWGDEWGDGGYYWVSYEDPQISASKDDLEKREDKPPFVFIDAELADNYDHNYYYDGGLSLTGHGVSSGGSFANVYTVRADERLEAVGFAPYDTDVNYSIQIYTDLTDDSDPESGTAAFDKPQTGKIRYSGYCTVPLTHPVDMQKGCKFSIVITMTKAAEGSQNVVYLWSDSTFSYQNLQCDVQQFPGQSFCKSPGYGWQDVGAERENPYTFRIKGYTVDVQTIEQVMLEESASLIETEKRELQVSVLPESASVRMLKWSTTNQTVATVDKRGVVTAVGEGTCDIKAAGGDGVEAACRITVRKKPEKTTGLTIKEITADSAKFAWTGQVINIDGYEVYRRQAGENRWTRAGEVDSTANIYEDTGLKPATAYEYEVRAYANSAKGERIYGDSSDGLAISTVQKPEKVQGFEVTEKGKTFLKLQWTRQPGVSGYIVEWGKADMDEDAEQKEGGAETLQGDETVSYTIEGLEPGTKYMCMAYAYVNSYTGQKITYSDDPAITEDNILDAIAWLLETTDSEQEVNPGPDEPKVDPAVEALKSEIQETLDTIEESQISSSSYTEESWRQYESALTAVKALMEKEGVTSEELERAQQSLINAIKALTFANAEDPGMKAPDIQAHDPQQADWKLEREKAALYVSESLQLKVSGVSQKPVWKSSDTKIAAVSADGKVKAKKKGKVTISATIAGVTKSCTLQVKASLSVSKAKLTLAAGKKKKATVTLALGKKLKVKVKSKKIAACTVGKLKGRKCKLTLQGKKKGKTTITITNKTTREKITINVTVK